MFHKSLFYILKSLFERPDCAVENKAFFQAVSNNNLKNLRAVYARNYLNLLIIVEIFWQKRETLCYIASIICQVWEILQIRFWIAEKTK